MRELQYPFDPNFILTKKKRIKKELLKETHNLVSKRVAILGGYTTNDIKLTLELFLLDQGIKPEFYESEYGQFYQDAIFENAELEAFEPDIIYICTSIRNIGTYPEISDSAENVDRLLKAEIEKYTAIWEALSARYHCPIIQNNFEYPYYRLLGNMDASDIHGKVNFVTRLNMALYDYAQNHNSFYICDVNYISADYGLKEWSDPFYWYMYKYAVNVNAIPYLAFNVSNIIKSIFGKNKKGFVLDLDNTLWGGVIGDDGIEGVILGPEESEGQAYLEFQEYIKEQQALGIILNIASKNDEQNALLGLSHPDSKLCKQDFIVLKANWDSKEKNFFAIADTLNLLPESLVFVDDNPAERHIVVEQLPGVVAPDIGEVFQYIQVIDRSGYFESTALSIDDRKRHDMYRENANRIEFQARFEDYADYLRSLEMKGLIKPFEPLYTERIAQLSNKSNQFNLTTRRYTRDEIERIAEDPHYMALYGKLIDRFGDNGVVSVVVGHILGNQCHIDLWIMSCRVLKRDFEYAMMDALVEKCIEFGIENIVGYYYPTAKNSMVRDFYARMGFKKINEDGDGNTKWQFTVNETYENKNTVIEIGGK